MGALQTLDLSPSSINRDAAPSRLGAEWSFGKNVRFAAGVGVSMQGEGEIYPGLPGPVFAARWGIQRGVPVLFYAGFNFIGCYDGAHHDLTPAGWLAVRAPWQIGGTIFNDYAILNCPPNAPVYVPIAHDVALPLPGWDPTWTCNGVASFKQSLVALGGMPPDPSLSYQTVRWSTQADPGTLPDEWLESPTNDAGLLAASQYPGPLIASAALGDDSLALYKSQAAFALSYIGGPFVMGLRMLPGIAGALGPNCAYSLGQQNVVLTLGDLVIHNGIQQKSLVDGRARAYLFNAIDPANFAHCYIAQDLERGEVHVAYPMVGSSGRLVEALVWRVQSGEISFRELSPSWCLFASQLILSRRKWSDYTIPWGDITSTWSEQAVTGSGLALLSCDAAHAKFLVLDGGSTIAGNPAVATLERMGIPMLESGERALLKRVIPRINGMNDAEITVRVGVQDAPGDAVAWEPDQIFTIGQTERVDCLSSGRYAAVHFHSEQPFSVEGFRLLFSRQGLE